MAEEKPSLHIDLDWKKQAQEEKKRLEEEEKKRADEAAAARQAVAAPAAVAPTAKPGADGAAEEAVAATGMRSAMAGPGGGARAGVREAPAASFMTMLNTMVTQTMLYLGEVPTSSGQTMMSLDMARHQVDTLGVLEEKTKGNLTEEEQAALDVALYEVRMRFVSVAGQIIAGAN